MFTEQMIDHNKKEEKMKTVRNLDGRLERGKVDSQGLIIENKHEKRIECLGRLLRVAQTARCQKENRGVC